MVKKDIIKFGKKIVEQKLATSFFGNLSIKVSDELFITKTGTMLDELSEDDIVKVNLFEKGEFDSVASSELIVHRMIYQKTSANAVMHTHSLYSILMGNTAFDYLKIDTGEALPFLNTIPIVQGKSGSEELALTVSNALENFNLVIVKDHGVFAKGENLKSCFIYISALEHYCKYIYLKGLLK
ncbi:class II aldolase/adducin family protein [Calditerrivibrio nitroreducens]|uniref:Class II aldolase/adducin family protein n=1 Tax=Calditerrivibrio nitroreducens (strain DSM 19672 / NBRC 101217 / Yu37-1) TaxID=768670 RepID=E4TEM9_CALNY|nr:class II aldolase/adducin family protein [Calditerrivibrio nitroreducens]ADR19386.1 class II aldolase/adducin family protein [Calditerrivibrio nitroreducens DSM 19672]